MNFEEVWDSLTTCRKTSLSGGAGVRVSITVTSCRLGWEIPRMYRMFPQPRQMRRTMAMLPLLLLLSGGAAAATCHLGELPVRSRCRDGKSLQTHFPHHHASSCFVRLIMQGTFVAMQTETDPGSCYRLLNASAAAGSSGNSGSSSSSAVSDEGCQIRNRLSAYTGAAAKAELFAGTPSGDAAKQISMLFFGDRCGLLSQSPCCCAK